MRVACRRVCQQADRQLSLVWEGCVAHGGIHASTNECECVCECVQAVVSISRRSIASAKQSCASQMAEPKLAQDAEAGGGEKDVPPPPLGGRGVPGAKDAEQQGPHWRAPPIRIPDAGGGDAAVPSERTPGQWERTPGSDGSSSGWPEARDRSPRHSILDQDAPTWIHSPFFTPSMPSQWPSDLDLAAKAGEGVGEAAAGAQAGRKSRFRRAASTSNLASASSGAAAGSGSGAAAAADEDAEGEEAGPVSFLSMWRTQKDENAAKAEKPNATVVERTVGTLSPKLRRSQSELKLDSLSLDPEPGVGEATVVVKTLDYFRRGERVAVCMHACVCVCVCAL